MAEADVQQRLKADLLQSGPEGSTVNELLGGSFSQYKKRQMHELLRRMIDAGEVEVFRAVRVAISGTRTVVPVYRLTGKKGALKVSA